MNQYLKPLALKLTACCILAVSFLSGAPQSDNPRIGFDHNGFSINGEKIFIYSGSVHYFRCPQSLWRDRLNRIKQAGFNTIQFYIPWNYHEQIKGQIDFSEMQDFIELSAEMGFYLTVRIGPYICGEWDHGGFPDWLLAEGIRNSSLRTNEPNYTRFIKQWYEKVTPYIRGHLITNGGNIILIQVENEYGDGAYFKREVLRDRYLWVRELGIDVPVVTCNTEYAWDNTDREMADIINGNNSSQVRWKNISKFEQRVSEARHEEYNAPTIILEMPGGQGMHSNFIGYEAPDLSPSDYKAVAKTALMEGAGLANYYMLYGGTNLDYWGGSYQSTSYANKFPVQCPIDEPGGLTESYYTVKLVGQWLNRFGASLLDSSPLAGGAKAVEGVYDKPPKMVQKVNGDMAFIFIREEESKNQKLRFSYIDPADNNTRTVPHNGFLELQPEEMKLLVANVPLAGAAVLKYSTSEILDISSVAGRTVVVLYAPLGTGGEAMFALDKKPAGISTNYYSWDEKNKLLTVNYTHASEDTVINLDGIELVIVNEKRAYGSWSISENGRQVNLISDAYFLRDQELTENSSTLDVDTRPGHNRFTLIMGKRPDEVLSDNRPLPYSWNPKNSLLSFDLQTPGLPDVKIEFSKAKFALDAVEDIPVTTVKELQPLEFMNIYHKGYVTYSADFDADDIDSMIVRYFEGSSKSGRSRQTVGDPALVYLNGKLVPEASGWHPRKIHFDAGKYAQPGTNRIDVIMEKIGRPNGAGGWGMGEPKGLAAVSYSSGGKTTEMTTVTGWNIAVGTQGQNSGFHQPEYNDSAWQTVQLGSWKQQAQAADGFRGIGWHRLSFDLDQPEDWEIPLKLRLQAATDAIIYLNGKMIGHYKGMGWQREFYLHDSYLNPKGSNIIAIAVRDGTESGGLYAAEIVPYEQYSVKKNRISIRH